ncbi:MAG: hypothetical protein QM731_09635 [Chitinophagaceae bacterium]
MGLFSNLFKPKNKIIAATPLGDFELIYSKKNVKTWTKKDGELQISVKGTNTEPDAAQISFLQMLDNEIQKLEAAITKRFLKEFAEADIDAGFTDWKQRFKIVAVGVMIIFEGEAYWNITFEDQEDPYAHFTLYIEGQKTTDFSIDT